MKKLNVSLVSFLLIFKQLILKTRIMSTRLKPKLIIFIIFFILKGFTFEMQAQIRLPEGWQEYLYSFDDSTHWHSLTIDTINNPFNIWQIGKPHKNSINSAFSGSRVIITDTVNSYPENTLSKFEFAHHAQEGFIEGVVAVFSGFYFVNADSLSDYGSIEFSPDNGNTWINLLTDTDYSDYYHWFTENPVLTGNSFGWHFFGIQLAEMNKVFEIDTTTIIRYRISFISDDINNQKDGIAFDDLRFQDHLLGLNEGNNVDSIEIYPNPGNDILYVRANSSLNEQMRYSLLNINGGLIETKTLPTNISSTINIEELKPGIYVIYILDRHNRPIKQQKIIKL